MDTKLCSPGSNERDFMMSLSNDIIDAFNTTSRYLDVISKINNIYVDNIIQIYPLELQLNQAHTSRFWIYICPFLII